MSAQVIFLNLSVMRVHELTSYGFAPLFVLRIVSRDFVRRGHFQIFAITLISIPCAIDFFGSAPWADVSLQISLPSCQLVAMA